MDINALPFDADEMLKGLNAWVAQESPTWDAGAVNGMLDLAARDLADMGFTIERIPGSMGLGDTLRATQPTHPKAGEKGVLIAGHMDTVHPVGTLKDLPIRREGDRAYGPGIWDMKSGNYLCLEAIRQLKKAGIETPLPITILFTPDEEIGTPAARSIIEAEASRARAVLVPEPGKTDGGVTSGRYAIARFNLKALGIPSHSGARLKEGKSAIRELCRRIEQIENMTTDDCTFSVGVIKGGQWVNCVSSTAFGEALSMAKEQADLDRGVEAMLALNEPGVFEVTRGVTRPVWTLDDGTRELLAMAEAFHKQVGMNFSHAPSGGGSDGNFTGAMGVPTIDGLGTEGEGGHTLHEHILVPTLASRGKVVAGLLATLS